MLIILMIVKQTIYNSYPPPLNLTIITIIALIIIIIIIPSWNTRKHNKHH